MGVFQSDYQILNLTEDFYNTYVTGEILSTLTIKTTVSKRKYKSCYK